MAKKQTSKDKKYSQAGIARQSETFGGKGHERVVDEDERLFSRVEKSYKEWDGFRKVGYKLVADYTSSEWVP